MNHIDRLLAPVFCLALSLTSIPAWAQAGTNPTVSDGASNTAGGSGALSGALNNANSDNSSGNTAFGDSALTANTSGSSNTAVGYGALANTTTGANNTATGSGALYQQHHHVQQHRRRL
jgi:hypothetical protein